MPDIDFRLQNNFPMSEVINAAQRKGQLDIDNQNKQTELFNQAMGAIGQAGASLHAQKQKVAQALALSNALKDSNGNPMVDPQLARTMEPDQVIAAAKMKQGYMDQKDLTDMLRRAYPGATPAAPAPSPATPVSSIPVAPSPQHTAGAILANDVHVTPMPDTPMESGGLPPATTGQAPLGVPITAPPVASVAPAPPSPDSAAAAPPPPSPRKMISPKVQQMLMRLAEANKPQTVYQYTPGKGLTAMGVKMKGDQVITTQAGAATSWADATPEEQALAKARYEGRLRSGDLGFRERTKINALADQYATISGQPKFSAYKADTNAAMAKFASSGKMGQNALSLNTALGHLSSAYDSYQAIGNTNEKWLNTPINTLRKQTNDPNVVALGINLNALQGELANVFKNTGATDQEISHWRDYLNSDLTPQQYIAASGKIDELLRSRLDAMDYQKDQAGGGTGGSLISPHGKEISTKMQDLKSQTPMQEQTPGFSQDQEQRLQMLLQKKKNGTLKS